MYEKVREMDKVVRKDLLASILIGSVIGGISLFNYFPGFLYTDSFVRWDQASSILTGAYVGGDFLTIAPSLFFSFVLFIAGSPAAFSFFQATLLCALFVFCLISAGGKLNKIFCVFIAVVFYFSTPFFVAYGLTHAPGVGVALAITFMCVLFVLHERLGIRFLNIILWSTLCAFFCFGFRQNSLVLLPLFIILVAFFTNFSKFKKWTISISLVVTALFVMMLPNILGWQTSNQLAKSVAWEMACFVKDGASTEYDNYLEPIGISKKIIEKVNCSNVLTLKGPKLKTKNDAALVYTLYWNLMSDSPYAFMVNKWRVWGRVIGASDPLEVTAVINEWPKLAEYGGYQKTVRRSQFVDYYHWFHSHIPVFRLPFVLFIFSFFMLVLAVKLSKELNLNTLMITLFVMATCYYLSFFLISQRHEVRYFFPSAYIYTIVIGMSFIVIVQSLIFALDVNFRCSWAVKCYFVRCKKILPSLVLAFPLLWVLGVAVFPYVFRALHPKEFFIQAYDLNDSNWVEGVSLRENNVLLVEASAKNSSLLRGLNKRGVISVGGNTASIESVHIKKMWIHISVGEKNLDPNIWGYPNFLKVSVE